QNLGGYLPGQGLGPICPDFGQPQLRPMAVWGTLGSPAFPPSAGNTEGEKGRKGDDCQLYPFGGDFFGKTASSGKNVFRLRDPIGQNLEHSLGRKGRATLFDGP